MRIWCWLFAVGSVCAQSGTEFSARLDTPLSSFNTNAGEEFRATVISPAVEGGKALLPEGSVVLGRVASARSVGVGLVRERAELSLSVYACRLPDGVIYTCSARLSDVDTARETTDSTGTVRGVLAAGGPAGLPRGLWRMPHAAMLHRPASRLAGVGPAGISPVVSLGLLAVRWTALRFPEPEIELPAGTELRFELTGQADDTPKFDAEPLPQTCAHNWKRLPRQVRRPGGEPADDVINVVFHGTRTQVEAAFEAAGWLPADPLNRSTFMKLYKAWTSMSGYPQAPVSRLLYEGREPDLVFQKSLNTVARRHHIRIWQIAGRDLWAGAATHDVSIALEFSGQVLTHRIDLAIDHERAKVFSDLRATGCLAEAGLIPVELSDAEGRSIQTDGRILRLGLQDCRGSQAAAVQFTHARPGSQATRMLRRFTLETRQYVQRDNYFYWGYRALRSGARKLMPHRGAVQVARQAPVLTTTSNAGM